MTRRVAAAVWDFVVGDDWRLALAAVAAIGLAAAACALGLDAWWLAPLIVLAALRWSLRGATPSATITQCDTSASDLPTPVSSSSPASQRGPGTGTR
jgi:HAMP domain-containing protein